MPPTVRTRPPLPVVIAIALPVLLALAVAALGVAGRLGQLVVAKVQGTPGITRTLTCPIVHLG